MSSTCSVSRSGQARMAREETMISIMYHVRWLTALAMLTGVAADVVPKPEKLFGGPFRQEPEAGQLDMSALNTALAFEPYRELATRTSAKPGVQQEHNLLFSPLGLASALALLSRVSGSRSRSQALEALGLAANSTEQTVETTMSALSAGLQESLTVQEGEVGERAQRAGTGTTGKAGAGSGPEVGTGVDTDAGAVDGTGTKAGPQSVGAEGGANGQKTENGTSVQWEETLSAETVVQLRFWSGLHVDGKPSLDYQSFLTNPQHTRPTTFNNISFETLMKDLQDSDKLILTNYVHFKGQWKQPFKRSHTVLRSFQLNATASVEVPMMFRDDSSEVMMLYDTNCSATVVKLPYSGRLASLLLLPKAELKPLEDCLSDSRMSFWLSNLKPGEYTVRLREHGAVFNLESNVILREYKTLGTLGRGNIEVLPVTWRAEIRFPKFQLRKSYSLKSLLRSCGVSSVFSDSADFSGVSPRTVKLIKALHEVTLEVEETKSEDREGSDVKLDFSVPPRVTFDRPFLQIIYDELTGFVLLMGKIADPSDI